MAFERILTRRNYEKYLQDAGNIPYFVWDDGYIGVFILHSSPPFGLDLKVLTKVILIFFYDSFNFWGICRYYSLDYFLFLSPVSLGLSYDFWLNAEYLVQKIQN